MDIVLRVDAKVADDGVDVWSRGVRGTGLD